MPSYFLAFITALIAVYALTPLVIKFAVKTGAMDKPDPRKVHKKPIPRLGGLAIYLAFMIAVCSMLDFSKEIVGLLLGGTFIVIVGIIDDFISLPAKVKLLGQILAACILVAFDIRIDFITDPFGDFIFLEYLAIPVTIFWIVGITNTVNLIDGLDGLAIIPIIFCASALGFIAYFNIPNTENTLFTILNNNDLSSLSILCSAIVGTGIGFFIYNVYPAKIFMGDVGSLMYGALLAIISIILGYEVFYGIIGLIFVIEILSTTIQVSSHLLFGKRIFRMAPLHHHFEKSGWSERKVIFVFWLFALICLIIGFIGIIK